MQDQWLSIIEYARKYNISDITVRRRIKTGRVHAVLKEGKYYIPANQPPPEELELRAPPPPPRAEIFQERRRPERYEREPFPQQRQPYREERPPQHYFDRQGGSRFRENNRGHLPAQLQDKLSLLDRTIQELKETEKKVQALYEQKEANLNQEIAKLRLVIDNKTLELNHIRQQAEDLKLLVKMMESPTE